MLFRPSVIRQIDNNYKYSRLYSNTSYLSAVEKKNRDKVDYFKRVLKKEQRLKYKQVLLDREAKALDAELDIFS